jgi:hypothetical protein
MYFFLYSDVIQKINKIEKKIKTRWIKMRNRDT